MKKEKVVIKKLGINGEGIAYINKKIVFVKGALVDEEVMIEIVKDNPNFKIGKIIKVLTPSKDRVKVNCRQSKECLGCQLMHLEYSKQLEFKKELLEETLIKYANQDLRQVEINDIIKSKETKHYKQVVMLPTVMFNGSLHFGIFQRESKYFTLLNQCFLQSEQMNQMLVDLEAIFKKHNLKEYNTRFKTGLRFLIAKEVDEKIQLIFITGKDRMKQVVINEMTALPNVVSVFLSVNTARFQEFEMEKYEHLYGIKRLELHFNNFLYRISAKSELPTEINAVSEIASILQLWLPKDVKHILEINCGIGLYSLLFPNDVKVKALDSSPSHIRDLKEALKINRITHVEAESGRLELIIPKVLKSKPIDLIMIHNDRESIDEQWILEIFRSKSKYIIYRSNNISSLSKDMNKLSGKYRLLKVQGIDSSPNTALMTTICLLERK